MERFVSAFTKEKRPADDTEVMIDPNVRVAGGLTFSGFEDVRGALPAEGQRVLVREPEANRVAIGIIERVDHLDRLIYIAVSWETLAPDALPKPEELTANLRRSASDWSTSRPMDRLLRTA